VGRGLSAVQGDVRQMIPW